MRFYDDDDSTVDELREEEKIDPIIFKSEDELLQYIRDNVKFRSWSECDYYGGASLHFEVKYKHQILFSESDYSGSRTCWDQ